MKKSKLAVIVIVALFSSILSQCFAKESSKMNWRQIDKKYSYEKNDLGLSFNNGVPTIKLWAPLAETVELHLFDKSEQTKEIAKFPMKKIEKGVWQSDLCSDHYGCFYQFEVKNPGKPAKRVLDPYARSMAAVTVSRDGSDAGASGDFVGKAAIVFPKKHGNCEPVKTIKGYEKREDAVIYELHVRDFTSDPSIASNLNARWGSYEALIDKLDYIKDLGVTHIQLLPVMAWYFGDETAMSERDLSWTAKSKTYNWGYDPQNYFSPDGAYSQNPNEPAFRIKELKKLINAVHEREMGVILDVVYTHMIKADFLEDIVPNYYFFRDSKGNFVGDFGNNMATNRKMAAKLIVDSVKYWHDEYKIDGMRFDMMGDATAEVIQTAYDEAAKINPDTLFLGEGWRTFKGHIDTPSLKGKGADQDWMSQTDSVGVFSDEIRNDLKSGFGCEGEPKFLTGGAQNIEKLFKNLKGQPTNFIANSPGAVVQYIEAHDNLPLYDVIAQSIKKDPQIKENDAEIHKRIRLGNLLVLTAQGTAFIHAGQEYGRTKQWLDKKRPEQKYHILTDKNNKNFINPYFIHDSYHASDAINKFDWQKATNSDLFAMNVETVEYTKGLIAIRQSSDAFRLGNKELIDKNVRLIKAKEIKANDLLIAYACKSTDNSEFYVFVNADSKKRSISADRNLEQGTVVADGKTAGLNEITKLFGAKINKNKLTLEALTAVIIKFVQ